MNREGYDLVIVGAGPAALTAAIYAGREGLKTLVLDKQVIGGQVATIDQIDNYPGFSQGIDGLSLAQNLETQARRFGAIIRFAEVKGVDRAENNIKVTLDNGTEVMARAGLIATGSTYRKLDIPGEADYYGRGVHYCATCDGALYKDKELVTIGGANSAVQEALFLTKFASHITMLVRSWIKADQILKDQLKEAIDNGKISLMEGWRPVEIVGDEEGVTGVKTVSKDESKTVACDGIFVFAGQTPNTDFLHGSAIELTDSGQIKVDSDLKTSLLGVWAAGDVRENATKQIVAAAGDGAKVAMQIGKYLQESSK